MRNFVAIYRPRMVDTKKIMNLKVIAYARNGHTDKFGIPRQSREESPILTRIVFEPEYSVPEALRGIEGFSHLWILWGFSKVQSDNAQCTKDWSPTVRPPRLGGNKRVGVFATRSPFRPNPIGMSSVRLLKVENGELLVSGADMMDGTPIYDVKPYLSFSDSHPDAQNGFAEATKDRTLEVEWRNESDKVITSIKPGDNTVHKSVDFSKIKEDLTYILSQDPRPAYQEDPTRAYKIDYAGWRVTFVVAGEKVIVQNVEKI